MEPTTIYVLELQDNHYYIGKSSNVEERYFDYINGQGAAWTKLHSPIKILTIYNEMSSFDEDKITKEYMFKYGINKVRGGLYVTVNLDVNTLEFLQKEIRGVNNCCIRCGKPGHFISTCHIK